MEAVEHVDPCARRGALRVTREHKRRAAEGRRQGDIKRLAARNAPRQHSVMVVRVSWGWVELKPR